ncbi:MAG TPA: NUDIX domain-containing protein [Gemmatimonadaceae bacterium]|jgi:8-oxo-dGTP diphosphatase
MPDRTSSARSAHAAPRALTLAVDVVLLTPRGNELAVLLVATEGTRGARGRDRWSLPTDAPRGDESLDDTAARVARDVVGATPSLLEQSAAVGGARRSNDGGPVATQVSVGYFGLVPDGGRPESTKEWVGLSELPTLSARHREEIDLAVSAMRARVDQQPIAFRLLPPSFTLSELQSVYELLLGRRLHKASFRRSLHASALVEATDEWRSEGRGRPAQLFRYAPPRRKRARRGIRFDLL